jgi:hypothetical protein
MPFLLRARRRKGTADRGGARSTLPQRAGSQATIEGGMVRTRVLQALAIACVLAAVAPARAAASATQASIFQDDNQLVYATPSHVAQTLAQLASLGVERIRVSVMWALVAPDPLSSQRPSFDATNPAAYPAGAWNRYDVIVTDAKAAGIGVDFDITSPDPVWAATAPSPAFKFEDYSPSPSQFGQFVQAVGTRYSGSYVVPTPTPPAKPPPTLAGIPLPPALGGTTTTPTPQPAPLPRVDYWEIWNEPNEGGWLSPQWRALPHGGAVIGSISAKGWVPASPVIYRRLLAAAWNALSDTGHGTDTILIGDTSAKGSARHGDLPAMAPVTFLRALYCVGPSDRPLTGTLAAELSCPANPYELGLDDPALLYATGFADHPYSFTQAPNVPSANRLSATVADLPGFERTLDRIFAAYGRSMPAGVPLYLTEYGYKSDPPNPYVNITQAQQADYINEGEYMAWRDPYVHALAQFELVDASPDTSEPVGSAAYWGTFQTGLIALDGVPKPSYYAYRLPVWLPDPRTGPRVTVWGQLRPADHDGLQSATIEYKPAGTSAFTPLTVVQTASPQGFILAHVSLSTPGALRLAWLDPTTGQVYHSRTVQVSR